jgi:nickel-dependent lactate racemase
MRYNLRYGAGFLSVDIRKYVVQEIIPKSVVQYMNLREALRTVLEYPHSSPPIKEQVTPNSTYAIIVEHPLTCKMSPIMLESVLSCLRSRAVQPEDISIIVTSPNNGQQTDIKTLNEKFGNLMEFSYPFHIHNSKAVNLDNLGNTPTYDTPILVNKVTARADFRIGIGSIRPDTFLGATGGRMAILPGICGHRTVERNSELTIQGNIGPFSISNPVNIDMSEISTIANLQFILNSIPDWKGTIANFVSGIPSEAWLRGVRTAKSLSSRTTNRKTDIVFVSTGRSPDDSMLFNAIDSLYSASAVTRRDGVIVLVAECAKGLGPDGFRNSLFNSVSEEDILNQASSHFEIGMERAWFFRKILKSRQVIICSRLRESMVNERLHCDAVKDPQEGLELARQYTGLDAEISILPNGHAVIPIFQ